jgi:hypothetical protein
MARRLPLASGIKVLTAPQTLLTCPTSGIALSVLGNALYQANALAPNQSFGLAPRQPADVLRGMQLLFESAFFTGVGYKTTMGIGQARRLARP